MTQLGVLQILTGFRDVPLAVGADESVQAAALRVVLARPPVQLHVAAAPVLAPVVGAHHYGSRKRERGFYGNERQQNKQPEKNEKNNNTC